MSYGAATATDTGDDSVAITYSAASGSTFAIGTTAVTATATDDSGNTSTCTTAQGTLSPRSAMLVCQLPS